MKKLFFAVVLTLGSFMFINAQPQDDSQEVATEVQEEVGEAQSIEAQEEAVEVQEAIQVTEDQKSDAVAEEESAVEE